MSIEADILLKDTVIKFSDCLNISFTQIGSTGNMKMRKASMKLPFIKIGFRWISSIDVPS